MRVVGGDTHTPLPIRYGARVVFHEGIVDDELGVGAVGGEEDRSAEFVGGVVADLGPADGYVLAVAAVFVDGPTISARTDLVLAVVDARTFAGVVVVCALANRAVPVEEAVVDVGAGPQHSDGSGVAGRIVLEGAAHNIHQMGGPLNIDGAATGVGPEQGRLVIEEGGVNDPELTVPHVESPTLAVIVSRRTVGVRRLGARWNDIGSGGLAVC